MTGVEELRIFISSPADVADERRRAGLVIERLNGELEGRLRLEPILWEEGFYRATEGFQSQISPVESVDIVVCILWKRLGSDLPKAFDRDDGTHRTGTEYEFETAMTAALLEDLPDIFLFRKTARVSFDADTVELEQAQFKSLEAFWQKWIQNEEGHFTAAFQQFAETDQFEVQFERLLRGWLAERQDEVVWPISTKGSPFRGLEAYGEDHAPVFFGRRRAVKEVVARLNATARRGCGFLLMLGMSGAGKSSLVRAGVMPRIMAPGTVSDVDRWRRCVMRPMEGGQKVAGKGDAGDNPLRTLIEVLFRDDVLPELKDGDTGTPEALFESLLSNPAGAPTPIVGALNRWAQTVGDAEGYDHTLETRLLVVVDQLEELFTLDSETRDRFVAVMDALSRSGRVWVIATMRSDFYGVLQAVPELVALKEAGASYDVLAPGPAEIREIIEGPAAAAGLTYGEDVESGANLATVLEEAAGAPESLPLLGFMQQELFNNLDTDTNTLLATIYRDLGGLEGVIEARAETVFNDLDADTQQTLPALIRLLVTVNEEGTATARTAPLDRQTQALPLLALVDAFIDARLLVTGGDSAQTTLRFAHEALLSHWGRAAETIRQNLKDLQIRARLEQAAALWQGEDHAEGRLLPDALPLSEAEDLLERLRTELDSSIIEYIEASTAAIAAKRAAEDEAIRKRRERTLKRTRAFAGVATILAIFAGFGAYYGFVGQREAESATKQARKSFGRSLGAVAKGLVKGDPLLALALASEAIARTEGGYAGFDARSAMVDARIALTGNGPFLLGSPIASGDAISFAMDRMGSVVAAGLRDGKIRIIDIQQSRVMKYEISGHQGGVEDLDFAGDGKRLASVGDDGALKIWDVSGDSGAPLLADAQSSDILWNVEFDASDNMVATVGEAGLVQLWEAREAVVIGEPLIRRSGDFLTVLFGETIPGLFVGNGDGDLFGWSLPSREPLFEVIRNAHTSDIWEMDLSPDGRTVATSSSDGTSALIDFATGEIRGRAFKSDASVAEVAFSANGELLIGGSSKGNLLLWDIAKDRVVANSAVGHNRPILSVKNNQKGNRIATLGTDQQIRLWSYDESRPLYREYKTDGSKAKAVAISLDGNRLAAGDSTGAVFVWPLDSQAQPKRFTEHTAGVWAAAFSPDALQLLTADRQGKVVVWSIEKGKPEFVISGDGKAVWSVGYTSDGKSFFVASDEMLTLHDAKTGNSLREFKADGDRIVHADLSADGNQLAIATATGRVVVWNVNSGERIRSISVEDDVVWSVIFSPDSDEIAAASSDEVVVIFDVETGTKVAELTGHAGGAMDLAYLSNGATLAVVDRKGQLHLWDTKTKRRLSNPIEAHGRASWRISTHPDGTQFVTSGDDGLVKLWNIFSDREACSLIGTAFDKVRQLQYLGEQGRPAACNTR